MMIEYRRVYVGLELGFMRHADVCWPGFVFKEKKIKKKEKKKRVKCV
jgi:hypothetical protein